MREILFRGKTLEKPQGYEFDRTWVYGDLIHSGNKVYIHPVSNLVRVESELGKAIVMHEVDPATVGQYIGLNDKNGVKIFEGDIIKTKKYGKVIGHTNVNDYDTFQVVYEDQAFRLKRPYREFLLVDDGFSKFEVIGNIHDNPELLEAEK